jgi:hypothetical protein
VEKYSGAGQATDGTMAHAHYMLDTQGYKQLSEFIQSFSILSDDRSKSSSKTIPPQSAI